ncbi:hypothetical protein CVIRNUC_004150 [Coccomyxa viridis]|uniref:Uncharacterized protein n=1 Tax=Coccomyxa viridis TaxID=1274662 RepID=A0AAV1I3M2_9CHLO|nr:hypothetical protein CVIRNUC_004150 [Coccomyxa viridis]
MRKQEARFVPQSPMNSDASVQNSGPHKEARRCFEYVGLLIGSQPLFFTIHRLHCDNGAEGKVQQLERRGRMWQVKETPEEAAKAVSRRYSCDARLAGHQQAGS